MSQTPDPHASKMRPRRKRRRVLFACLALGLIVGLAELGGAVAWRIMTGEMFTWGRASVAREQARTGDGAIGNHTTTRSDAELRAVRHASMLHPYLGFVHDGQNLADPSLPISRFGLHGKHPIRQRSSDRYIVGILGGSVALMLGLHGEQGLLASLQRSPHIAGRKIEIVNMALGGYKQPQQLLALQLMLVLGGEFDCILNLDGFNEVVLVNENVPLGVPAWFPRSWARLLDAQPSPEQLARLGHIAVLAEQRRASARTGDTLWWSPLAQFVWLWRDRDAAAKLATLRQEAERATPADNPAIKGPGTDGQTVQQASDDMVRVWQRASRQLHTLCKQNGIRYFHFLQPNQYVPDSKPMGAEELAAAFDPMNAWRPFVVRGFPKLQAAGKELQAAGIAFTDLTNIFSDHPEPIYTDTCCHFNRHGNTILANHIAAAVRSTIDLAGIELQRIVAVPERLQLTSPITRTPIQVLGVGADGRTHDVSGVGFGTRITAAPADNVDIASNGSIRAARRGDATLRIAKDGMTATVEVTADWPDIFEGEDALPAANNEVPIIRLNSQEVAAGAKTITVDCSNMPKAPMRLLATSPRPLPTSPIAVTTLGLKLTPITNDGTTARVQISVTVPPGHPQFLRFYALDASLTTVTAASNTVVITRN